MTAASIHKQAVQERSLLPFYQLLIGLVGFLCFFSGWWYVRTYGNIGFDSVVFTLTGDMHGVNVEHLLGGALPAVAATALSTLPLYWLRGKPMPGPKAVTALVSAVSLVLTGHAAYNVGLLEYVVRGLQTSSLYSNHYADPQEVSITFPEEKRNLIYIFMESMEVSYLSQTQGGGVEENLIPNLYSLAQSNVNFSHNSDVGGFRDVTGATWTMGAMVAQTGGIHLKTDNGDNKEVTLPGLTTLSDILHRQGYQQALMVGSDADFGSRKSYFLAHGTDQVYDLFTAWEDGPIEDGYDNAFWGFEDSYLYEYAKEKLTELSQGDQPFAFTMLTVDTHSPDGYLCSLCGSDHQEAYANVVSCADRQVSQFLSWLETQPYYENTTIVIAGDHRSMNYEFFVRNVGDDYERHIYNCFINATAEPAQTTNRQFTSLDLLPTTLAALGCTIEGDRLGLGTNLFSGEATLMEELGYDALCDELNKHSDYYDKFLNN